jgi:predicted MFS family arabinose efflux permease
MLMVFAQCSTVLEFDLVAPILGATAFGYTPLLYVLVTEASAESSTGSSSGLANAIWQVGGTLSPLAVGLVFSATQSFEFALGTLAIGPLCGACLLCFVETEAASRDVVPVT